MCFEGSDYFPCCGRLVGEKRLIRCVRYWQRINPRVNRTEVECAAASRERFGLEPVASSCEDCLSDPDDAVLSSLRRLFGEEAQVYADISYEACLLSEMWREVIE
jgi:hypothetical protein